jgi:hypothetical protein
MKVPPTKLLVLVLAAGGLAATFGPYPGDPASPEMPAGDRAIIPVLPPHVPLRLFAKAMVADDAAAGRLSLVEAAALFAALNRLPPVLPHDRNLLKHRAWSRHLPDHTEEERLCLQVIGYAFIWLNDHRPDGAVAAAAVVRLEREFAVELRHDGGIRLPDVPPGTAEALMNRARGTAEAASRGIGKCRTVVP